MSDVSQGPGWWIASDGKWYPPHLHPSARDTGSPAPDTEPPGPTAPADEPGASGSWPVAAAASWPPAAASSWPPAAAWPVASDAFGSPSGPIPPPRRSRTTVIAVIAVVVLLVLAAGGFVVFGNTKSASAAVIDAVNGTLGNKTAHTTVTLSESGGGTNVTATGTGAFDFTGNALQLDMTVQTAGQQVPVDLDYLGGLVYENVPGLDQLIPGKSWISLDLSSVQKAEGGDTNASGVGNPSVMLQMLTQQGNKVTALGASTVDGEAVNGYAVAINSSTVLGQLKRANLPAWMRKAVSTLKVHDLGLKVFIDHTGLLRSLSVQLNESGTAGAVTLHETLDFSDYGAPVTVAAPPADQVASFAQFLQAEKAAEGTTSS